MEKRIKEEKQKLRQTLRALMDALPQDYLARSSRAIEQSVLALDAWKQANTVFVYVSVGREPDTRRLIAAAMAAGKTVAVPRTFAEGKMEARVIRSLDELQTSRFGIPEPGAGAPVPLPEEINLIIVPCIAADRRGYRLGHGGGYYDRYLAQAHCLAVCLCCEMLLQTTLPHDTLDIPVEAVVTEQRIYHIR